MHRWTLKMLKGCVIRTLIWCGPSLTACRKYTSVKLQFSFLFSWYLYHYHAFCFGSFNTSFCYCYDEITDTSSWRQDLCWLTICEFIMVHNISTVHHAWPCEGTQFMVEKAAGQWNHWSHWIFIQEARQKWILLLDIFLVFYIIWDPSLWTDLGWIPHCPLKLSKSAR